MALRETESKRQVCLRGRLEVVEFVSRKACQRCLPYCVAPLSLRAYGWRRGIQCGRSARILRDMYLHLVCVFAALTMGVVDRGESCQSVKLKK